MRDQSIIERSTNELSRTCRTIIPDEELIVSEPALQIFITLKQTNISFNLFLPKRKFVKVLDVGLLM